MMDVALENVNDSSNSDPSFLNISTSYDNISEDISSCNLSDNGTEKSFEKAIIGGIVITEFLISIFGALGNGVVIWLLGFCIKRNSFMIYIPNLAVADLGVLLSILLYCIWYIFIPDFLKRVYFCLFRLTYSASQFLLTAVSIDRCVAAFFPLWYQCKRPVVWSTIICAVIWVLSILLTAISCTLKSLNLFLTKMEDYYQFMVNALLCLPVMTIAALALFIKVGLKTRQRQRRKLLTIIFLTLFFFVLFAFPLNVMIILFHLHYVPKLMISAAYLLACLNSSINPAIYFLVGGQWKSRRRESMKTTLQKVFKEEESCAEETSLENRV